jgi:hypothetical protein
MKIKIKEFQGNPVTSGFFPKEGVKMLASRWVLDGAGKRQRADADIYECESEEQYHNCLDTDLVEAVVERKSPGRPKKVED